MTNPYREFFQRPLQGVFGPLAWPGTWARLFYLMLGFPLGLSYFVFYAIGLGLGVGLLVLAVGALIVAIVFFAALPLGIIERWLANRLLDADVGPTGFEAPGDEGFVEWVKDTLANPVAWKAHLFLLLRFPLGLASWLVAVVTLTVSGAFVFAPLVVAFGGRVNLGPWSPATPAEALPLTALGLLAFLASIHLLNGIAWSWGALARVLLGRSRYASHEEEANARRPLPTSG
ncbi:MAG: sensor domain-containing protein [Gemmatimonadetes bacterium]|nr:sensor domain-containing protein [Gemmatimonadota bacterium]